MKKTVLLIIAIVLVFLTSAIVSLPAQLVVAQAPLPNQLKINGVRGTLWQGQASSVVWQGTQVGNVSWTIQPLKLLTGHVEANVRFGRGSDWQMKGRGTVSYGMSGFTLSNFIASMPVEQVVKMAPPLPVPLGLSGPLELSIKQLKYAQPYCESGRGALVWNTNTIGTPLADLTVGPVVADIVCSDNRLEVRGSSDSAQVSSEFSATLSSSKQYDAKAWFKPQAEFPEALAQQLKWLPSADAKGQYHFSYKGRL